MLKIKFLIQIILTFAPSAVRIFCLRFMGHSFAVGSYIAPFAVVVAGKIRMGEFSRIRPFSIINCGKNLSLGPYSEISNFTIINGDESLFLGLRSVIGVGNMIDLHRDVTLGEYSATGVKNVLMTHGLFWPCPWGYKAKFAPIRIGDLVWITSNVKIFAGAELGNEVFILPNAIINGKVKDKTAYYSNSFEEKNQSVAFFKEKVSLYNHRAMLGEIVDKFCKKFGLEARKTFDENDLKKGLIFKALIAKANKEKFTLLFFAGIKDVNFFNNKEPGVFAYDLQKLVFHSGLPNKFSAALLKIMRSEFGMRSMDAQYVSKISVYNKSIDCDNEKYLAN